MLTGRIPVRHGMGVVGMPHEFSGMREEEVTIAEVLSEAGYATAFFGKGHLGDIEESYLHNQGFDEALWTPYNQVASLYNKPGQRGGLVPAVYRPEDFGHDPYDLDTEWRPKGYVYALEGKTAYLTCRVFERENKTVRDKCQHDEKEISVFGAI